MYEDTLTQRSTGRQLAEEVALDVRSPSTGALDGRQRIRIPKAARGPPAGCLQSRRWELCCSAINLLHRFSFQPSPTSFPQFSHSLASILQASSSRGLAEGGRDPERRRQRPPAVAAASSLFLSFLSAARLERPVHGMVHGVANY